MWWGSGQESIACVVRVVRWSRRPCALEARGAPGQFRWGLVPRGV